MCLSSEELVRPGVDAVRVMAVIDDAIEVVGVVSDPLETVEPIYDLNIPAVPTTPRDFVPCGLQRPAR